MPPRDSDTEDEEENVPSTSAKAREPDNAAFRYYRHTLRSPKYILSPMVEQSELAWRMMARKHGADLCFTPMIHSAVFVRDNTYRCDNISAVAEDRPLIAQFCANDPEQFVSSIKLMAEFVDGVDLNLGCPQMIAKRGNYGAFLMESWGVIYKLINSASTLCPEVPISAKIRVFDDEEKTIDYAKMIEGAGAKMLTVHGRTREMKGAKTGLADWDIIRKIKEAVDIPVVANGNIQVHSDLKRCLDETLADGVMSAEGHLHNPYIFAGEDHPTVWYAAHEYLSFVKEYPAPLSAVRGHLFKLFHHSLQVFDELRDALGRASKLEEMEDVVEEMQKRCQYMHSKYLMDPKSVDPGGLMRPHWLCQPYFRPLPGSEEAKPIVKQHFSSTLKFGVLDKMIAQRLENRKRKHEIIDNLSKESGLSKTLVKKLEKRYNDSEDVPPDGEKLRSISDACLKRLEEKHSKYATCSCMNPMGAKCEYNLCKKCCKSECQVQRRNCSGHNWWFGDKSGQRELMLAKARARAIGSKLNDL